MTAPVYTLDMDSIHTDWDTGVDMINVNAKYEQGSIMHLVPVPTTFESKVLYIKATRERLGVGLKEAKDISELFPQFRQVESARVIEVPRVEVREVVKEVVREVMPERMTKALVQKIDDLISRQRRISDEINALCDVLPPSDLYINDDYTVSGRLQFAAMKVSDGCWALDSVLNAVGRGEFFRESENGGLDEDLGF